MVNAPRSDNWVGYNGYTLPVNNENTESIMEKMFFTRNNEAVRWILLTTRLPSATTDGIHAKSESTSTIWAALHAASLPEPNAMLQSASFNARTSLTPSPVIATTFPSALMAFTSFLFCSGDTLPNTVYCLTALAKSASVTSSVAST